MKKNKKVNMMLSFLALAAVGGAFLLNISSAEALSFTYQPSEKIPGFETETIADLPKLIEAIYGFFVWAVGICAFFMITVGGFSYMTSAGNTSKAGAGKKIIMDALIGLGLVLTAVLIFSIINPNITTLSLQISPAAAPPGGPPPPPAGCTGTVPPNSHSCINMPPLVATPIRLAENCDYEPSCKYVCNPGYELRDGTVCVSVGPQPPAGHNLVEDQRVRDLLSADGITVNRSCVLPAPITCVDGLAAVAEKVKRLKSAAGCGSLTITGGTEGPLGGHRSSCHTLANPNCVDIRTANCIKNYFSTNKEQKARDLGISKICTTPADEIIRYNCNTNEGESHFHFAF